MEVGQPTKTPAYHREPVVPLAQPVKKPQPVKNTNTRGARDNKNKVNFNGGGAEDEKKREKYLTAKYGAHQMALIRKRLKVEMWMYEHLQKLFLSEVVCLIADSANVCPIHPSFIHIETLGVSTKAMKCEQPQSCCLYFLPN